MRTKAKTRSGRKKRSIFLRLLPVAVFLYLLFALWNMHVEFSRAKAAATQTLADRDAQAALNEELRYRIENSEESLEQQARQNGYGKSGETVYKEAPGLGN